MRRLIPNWTRGTQRAVYAHILIALTGAGLSAVVMMQLEGGRDLRVPFSGWELWCIATGALGAALSLYLHRDRMGHGGAAGALRGAAGAVWISGSAAVIAGTLALPLFGTMFGPFALLTSLAASPATLGLWLFNMGAVHWLLRARQAERDSIFNWVPQTA